MHADDFRRIALSLEGAEESSHMCQPDLPGGRQNLCDTRIGAPGLREPHGYPGAAGGVRGGTARGFRSHRLDGDAWE